MGNVVKTESFGFDEIAKIVTLLDLSSCYDDIEVALEYFRTTTAIDEVGDRGGVEKVATTVREYISFFRLIMCSPKDISTVGETSITKMFAGQDTDSRERQANSIIMFMFCFMREKFDLFSIGLLALFAYQNQNKTEGEGNE